MTKLRCTSERGVVLRPVRASAGLEALYYRQMHQLIREMSESVEYWVRATYRQQEHKIAQDSVASVFQKMMDRLTRQWRKRFEEAADTLAERFVKGAERHADNGLMATLKSAGFTVKFRPSANVKQQTALAIQENVTLIKSIPEQYMQEVSGLVNRSAMAGRDLATLTDELSQRYQITRKRAAFIARDQNNKATSTINRTRQMDLGITEAEWAHSHGGKHPRESHVEAGRKRLRYKLSEGAMIDGKRIFPGEEINCRCVARPIIPGFDD